MSGTFLLSEKFPKIDLLSTNDVVDQNNFLYPCYGIFLTFLKNIVEHSQNPQSVDETKDWKSKFLNFKPKIYWDKELHEN